jgi:hypothetical protein
MEHEKENCQIKGDGVCDSHNVHKIFEQIKENQKNMNNGIVYSFPSTEQEMRIGEVVRDIQAVPMTKSKTRRIVTDFLNQEKARLAGEVKRFITPPEKLSEPRSDERYEEDANNKMAGILLSNLSKDN